MLQARITKGEDLNGDGDTQDRVVHVDNLATGESTNLGARFTSLVDNWLVYSVCSFSGVDLNGDGDTDDAVVHVRNLSTGETKNMKLSGSGRVSREWFVLFVSERG